MKVALYARVSSEKQDVELSVSAQLKALRDYAGKNGHEVVAEFVDEAESGKSSNRPQFLKMIAVAKKPDRPFEGILVWKYSRFARSREDSIVFKTILRKKGVSVVSITEPLEDSPQGKLFEAIIESMDEYYSANLGEEVTRGMRESASRGFYMASHAPYGYRRIKVKDGMKERPKLATEPREVQVVTRVFKEAALGKGLKGIIKDLNNEGIASPRGNYWAKTTLHKILRNETYTGTMVWGKNSIRKQAPIKVQDAFPPIIDYETFNKVQKLLRSRDKAYLHPKRAASNYLLSGLAKCGYCGKALIGHEAKSGKFNYYVCGTLMKRGSGTCEAKYLNSQLFERTVIDNIRARILTRENLEKLVKLVNEDIGSTSKSATEQLGTINKEIVDTNQRLSRHYDALETGKVKLEDLAPRIQQLRIRLEQLEMSKYELQQKLSDRKVELADLKTVMKYVDELGRVLSESPLVERKSFIKSFVKEVEVKGDDVTMKYILPIKSDGQTEEKLSVLSTVHYGGAEGIRTPYLLTASQTLSQLSYSPTGLKI